MPTPIAGSSLIFQGRTRPTSLCGLWLKRGIAGGVVHALPQDLADALKLRPAALATWDDITPLARNEWICWIESAKKPETQRKHIGWGCENLTEGKRRPCCWPGCPHREKGS